MSRRKTNTRLRDPITVRSTSSGLSICYYCSFGFFWIIFYPFPHYKALFFYLIISPVPTCLVHNCETSQRSAIPICYHPCLEIIFPLISHQRGRRLGTRSTPLLEEREDKLVWVQGRKGTERHVSKRLEKRSKS